MTMVPQETTQGEMIPFETVEKMAAAIAKSGLFGVKTSEQALGLMLIAQAEGRHPALAARDYHIIDGRPSLKADTMLARFQDAGGAVKWETYTETECKAVFTHPQGGSVPVEWTIKDAEKKNLTKNPAWKNYPRAMLRARCISEGVRTVLPGVLAGMYTPEEVRDFQAEREPPQGAEVLSVDVETDQVARDPGFDRPGAVGKIMAILPSDDAEIKLGMEEHGIIVPDCPPSEFRKVLDECLMDQIQDREHAGAIYKAMRSAANGELDLEYEEVEA